MFRVRQNGKIVEEFASVLEAERAFWIFTAQELKNNRTANLELDAVSAAGVRPPECCVPPLAAWAVAVLVEHGLM